MHVLQLLLLFFSGGSKELFKFEDIEVFRASTGASSVMIARQAEWNCSIFRKEGKLPLYDVIKAYLIYVGTGPCGHLVL